MKAFNIIKKNIGKTKNITEEGITATEKFQRVFFSSFENIQKVPHNIKELFLSNVMYRTFSHAIYQTIDERISSFFPEKVETNVKKYENITNVYTWINLDPALVRRSRKICLAIANTNNGQSCEVHIQPNSTGESVLHHDDLFFYSVPPDTESYFQFEISSTICHIGLRFPSGGPGNVSIKTTYMPL